ncbi:TetR/AcrR family transcriptional regulator [Streptomyces sp. NPDC059697]|uniref:TetR/AcrR family transcriptional regulator n=1 Tax=Streptomyces sp. NPDC059697 TaxID=3346912 RepID=UPI0036C3D56C
METESVSRVSGRGGQRADVIVEAAGRLFFAPGSVRVSMDDLARELGMSKKTIYRHLDSSVDTPAFGLGRKRTPAEQGKGRRFAARADRRSPATARGCSGVAAPGR